MKRNGVLLILLLTVITACDSSQPLAAPDDITEQIEIIEETPAPTFTTVPDTAVVTAEPTLNGTDEVAVSPTPRIFSRGLETLIYVNARSCPWITCPVVASFAKDERIEGGQLVDGGRFEGSNHWWRITHNGNTMYIHALLVREVSQE
jgi:hypothetical protein